MRALQVLVFLAANALVALAGPTDISFSQHWNNIEAYENAIDILRNLDSDSKSCEEIFKLPNFDAAVNQIFQIDSIKLENRASNTAFEPALHLLTKCSSELESIYADVVTNSFTVGEQTWLNKLVLIKKNDEFFGLNPASNEELFDILTESANFERSNGGFDGEPRYINLQTACTFFFRPSMRNENIQPRTHSGLMCLLRSGLESQTISITLGQTIEKLHALSQVCLNLNEQMVTQDALVIYLNSIKKAQDLAEKPCLKDNLSKFDDIITAPPPIPVDYVRKNLKEKLKLIGTGYVKRCIRMFSRTLQDFFEGSSYTLSNSGGCIQSAERWMDILSEYLMKKSNTSFKILLWNSFAGILDGGEISVFDLLDVRKNYDLKKAIQGRTNKGSRFFQTGCCSNSNVENICTVLDNLNELNTATYWLFGAYQSLVDLDALNELDKELAEKETVNYAKSIVLRVFCQVSNGVRVI